jgi:hypothetical protein
VKTCRAKLFTLGPDNVFSRKVGEHNHDSVSLQVLNRQKINNQVKRKACSDPSARPRKLIHHEILVDVQNDVMETLTMTDIKRISNNIDNARLQLYLKLPSCTVEVQEYLDSIQITKLQKENFLLCNNKTFNIVIFSCKSNI